MGSNLSVNSIVKAGKCVNTVHRVCQAFQKETTGNTPSGRHTRPKFLQDLNSILGQLQEIQAFMPLSTRAHTSFKWKTGIFEKLTKEELVLKIQANIDQY